jgi:hypothetical protein
MSPPNPRYLVRADLLPTLPAGAPAILPDGRRVTVGGVWLSARGEGLRYVTLWCDERGQAGMPTAYAHELRLDLSPPEAREDGTTGRLDAFAWACNLAGLPPTTLRARVADVLRTGELARLPAALDGEP